jgi:hypothetical protein
MRIIVIVLLILLVVVPLIHRIMEIALILVSPRFFVGMGVQIFKRKLQFEDRVKISRGKVRLRKTVGNYVFTQDGEIYVYPKLFWAGFFNVPTFFALRIFGVIKRDIVQLKVKISGFTVVYVIVFLAGLIAFTVWSILTGQELVISLMGSAVLLIALIAFIRPFFAVEDNYDSMIEELEEIIINQEYLIEDLET